MTRLELLEKVNALNVEAQMKNTGAVYWTVPVLYNSVIFERDAKGYNRMVEVIKGVPK